MFITSYSARLDRTKVTNALRMAWQDKNHSMKVGIVDVQQYTDAIWNLITKIDYFIHINGTNPEESGYTQPKDAELTKHLQTAGIRGNVCSCKGLRHHKLYLNSGKKTLNHTAVQGAIKSAWLDKNNETKELIKIIEVNIKQAGKARRKRAAVRGSELVDSNGDTVFPIDYTVAVDGQEANHLYITEPTDDEIKQRLQNAGFKDCECEPSKTGTVKLKGQTRDDEKENLKQAIAEAVAAANPDIKPEDLDVKILDIKNNIKDDKGNPISSVHYAVSRKDGETVEAIRHPSDDQMMAALKQTGRSLAGTPDPAKDEGADWQAPVGIVCAVLAGIFVMGIMAYIVKSRRHRKRKHFKQQQRDEETITPSPRKEFDSLQIPSPNPYQPSRDGHEDLQNSSQHDYERLRHPSEHSHESLQHPSYEGVNNLHQSESEAFSNPTYEHNPSPQEFELSVRM
ncbi:uncharacterized protein LOC121376281 [Gigantopelta aegis]|uniref:uncharacterized protein LOC121376281 n=1 Tax=Gigantopelta aegis TaxID=1735272 RepID=UPI001B888FAF|nr:uncharacterized protein LOC121376281 [Gigantopelta aegis]